MTLIKISQDSVTLVNEMFDMFKQHLRILHDVEDDTIHMYLAGAIDAIATYMGNDIFYTSYQVYYPQQPDYRPPSSLMGWYCGKWYISNVQIIDTNGVDKVADYTIDYEHGMIYPHPLDHQVWFNAGFQSAADVPPNLTNIIFRYAAHLFENREAVRVGEPKHLPDWVNFALASIWKPRI